MVRPKDDQRIVEDAFSLKGFVDLPEPIVDMTDFRIVCRNGKPDRPESGVDTNETFLSGRYDIRFYEETSHMSRSGWVGAPSYPTGHGCGNTPRCGKNFEPACKEDSWYTLWKIWYLPRRAGPCLEG